MINLISGATATLRRLDPADRRHFGMLLTPDGRHSRALVRGLGLPFALDNCGFTRSGEPLESRLPASDADLVNWFASWGDVPGCLFAACPDYVADARKTMQLLLAWGTRMEALGLPLALVIQDGFEDYLDPALLATLAAVFIGGSTEYKLSRAAADVVREAKRLRLWVHMGRVNSLRRLEYAYRLGVDSVDGTGYNTCPDHKVAEYLRWIRGIEGQPSLWPEEPNPKAGRVRSAWGRTYPQGEIDYWERARRFLRGGGRYADHVAAESPDRPQNVP